jgi:tetratricopeptide (TPR) repeat protein
LSPRVRWLVLLSLVSLLLILAPQPSDGVAVKALKTGSRLAAPNLRQQDLNESKPQDIFANRRDVEAAYRRAISRRPRDPQPWRHLGDLYTTWGRPNDAVDAYGQALLRGDQPSALDRRLAQLFGNLGDSRLAAHHWTKYLARSPDDRGARMSLALAAIQLADWNSARAELEQLLVDDPANTLIHTWLGLLLSGPDPLTGMEHLERANDDPVMVDLLAPMLTAQRLSVAVDDPAYRSALLGVALLNLDVSTLQKLTKLNLGERSLVDEDAFTNAITTLALRSLLAAVYGNPAYADAYAYLGQALDQLGWSDWAQASLGYALELAPQSPVVQTLVGLYWDRHGSPAVARKYFEGAYVQDQDNASLCLEIATTYLAEGEYTAAEVWLLHAVEIAPDDALVWEALTQYYVDLGIDVDESGLAAVNRLVELAPDDARAHDLMGRAYFLTREDVLARTSLDQALALDPGLASAHYHLGRLNARQGRYAEAALDFQRATDHDIEGLLSRQLERARDELPQTFRYDP